MKGLILLVFALISIFVSFIMIDFVNLKSLISKPSDQILSTTINNNKNPKIVRSGQKNEVLYDYSEDYKTHYLVINLNDPEKVCFKATLGLDNLINEKDDKGKLLRNFVLKSFEDLISDDNAKLATYPALASFNTSFFRESDDAPLDLNFIQGTDYSVARNWTSTAISKDNTVEFIRDKKEGLYNVAGGGPKIITDGKFDDPCLSGALDGSSCIETESKDTIFEQRKTILSKTSDNFMLVTASSHLRISEMADMLNSIAQKESIGVVMDANMLDGGSSVSMAYDNNENGKFEDSDIKITQDKIVASMLVFKGDACKYR